jgi:D-alanyl-D-alanine carboxypeptidase/D-alanyl-D-alanine-endopeptidase (penicillin-binding protein 4)
MAAPRPHAPEPPSHAGAIALATTPREGKDPSDPHEQRVLKLRERLIEVLKDGPLSRTKVGVEVMQASDGDVLFAHNAGVPFNPASNTKMLTTAAAMSYLGGDYRYHTALYGPMPDENGVVNGDVVLRGSGDPSLTNTDLAEIARNLQCRGITKIDGDLYADPKFHDPRRPATAAIRAWEKTRSSSTATPMRCTCGRATWGTRRRCGSSRARTCSASRTTRPPSPASDRGCASTPTAATTG